MSFGTIIMLVVVVIIALVVAVKFFSHNPDDLKKASTGIDVGVKKTGNLISSAWSWLGSKTWNKK